MTSITVLTYGKEVVLKTVCGNSSWLTPRAAEFAYVVALEGMHHLTPMQVGRGQNLYAQHLNIMDTFGLRGDFPVS